MPQPPDQAQHNIELQSLRGIAAAVVMIHHGLRTIAGTTWAHALSEVPLNAHAAVIIFFVLSGYVLSRSLLRRGNDAQGIGIFYVRRLFRIFPALWAGIALGTICLAVTATLPAPDLSEWMQGHYVAAQATPAALIGSLVGLHNYLLPTSWTITIELCASLWLPALVLLFLRARWAILPTILLLAMVTAVSGPALRNIPFYLVDFALGAALACAPAARRLRPGAAGMLLATALLAFIQIVPLTGARYAASALAQGLASAVLIRGLVTRPVAWMRHPALVALGDWSYSVYLLHLPIAFMLARVMSHSGWSPANHDIAAAAVALATAVITLPASALVYRRIEQPGIALGGRLIRQWRGEGRAATSHAATSHDAMPLAADHGMAGPASVEP